MLQNTGHKIFPKKIFKALDGLPRSTIGGQTMGGIKLKILATGPPNYPQH